nr:hypothetical protein [Lichenihabitans psoromatis]
MLQFPHEGGVGHLYRVALDHQLAHPIHSGAIGDQDDVDTWDHGRVRQRLKIGVAHLPGVEVCARRLPLRDRVGQGRGSRRPVLQGDGSDAFDRLRRSSTRISLKAALTEMGSVAGINTPKSAAPIQFQFNRKRTPRATADAAINTPGKARSGVAGSSRRMAGHLS